MATAAAQADRITAWPIRLWAIVLTCAALAGSWMALRDLSGHRRALQPPRLALASEPLDAEALLSLANRPGLPAAERSALLMIAGKVTRRNRRLQAELVADAAAKGDFSASLAALDRALMVQPEAGTQIFTGLARSADDPKLRDLLIPYAARPWFPDIIAIWAIRADEPDYAAQLIVKSSLRPADLRPGTIEAIVQRQIAAGNHRDAVEFVRRAGHLAVDDVRSFRVDRKTSDSQLAPFSWRPGVGAGGNAAIEANGDVVIVMQGDQRFMALERMTALSAGRYSLHQREAPPPQTTGVSASWSASCISTTIPDRAAAAHARSAGARTYRVIIPKGCPIQQWRLILGTPPEQGEHRFTITSLSIQRQ